MSPTRRSRFRTNGVRTAAIVGDVVFIHTNSTHTNSSHSHKFISYQLKAHQLNHSNSKHANSTCTTPLTNTLSHRHQLLYMTSHQLISLPLTHFHWEVLLTRLGHLVTFTHSHSSTCRLTAHERRLTYSFTSTLIVCIHSSRLIVISLLSTPSFHSSILK